MSGATLLKSMCVSQELSYVVCASVLLITHSLISPYYLVPAPPLIEGIFECWLFADIPLPSDDFRPSSSQGSRLYFEPSERFSKSSRQLSYCQSLTDLLRTTLLVTEWSLIMLLC